ncbi:MAG: RNA-binding protein [Pedobacter sp.]|nr:MAG: RNA-binding protein [Pedobacter sp.]
MTKIFIGGLSSETSEIDLVGFVSAYAEVSTIKIVRDRATKKSKGFAFLEMSSRTEAEKAVDRIDGLKYKNRVLTVKIS